MSEAIAATVDRLDWSAIGAEIDTRSGPDGTTHSLRFEMPEVKPGAASVLPVA